MTAEQRLADGVSPRLSRPSASPSTPRTDPARPPSRASSTATGRPTPPSSWPRLRAGRPGRSPTTSLRRCRRPGMEGVEGVEVAGPGFVNFRLATSWLHHVLVGCRHRRRGAYATPDLGGGERVQIEFVSANPTGPLHVGNGWFGSYGDALGRVMSRVRLGGEPGVLRQRHRRADPPCSARACLARRRGDAVPEEGYQGEYVTELAEGTTGPTTSWRRGGSPASGSSRTSGRRSARLDIVFDEWYSQASIEESGPGRRDDRAAARAWARLRAGRGDVAPVHRVRRQPGPGAGQVERRRHLPRR